MCGFVGFVDAPKHDMLMAMGTAIQHRGPDQDGLFESPDYSVVHRRLSIIDLSEAGRQPLVSPDGRFVIAYNGEVYNYRELRKTYEAQGWVFRTQTDTECFLAAMSLHGLRDLELFHGIFAFSLWDTKERRCYIARDRMGIKPLFVTRENQTFAFASEIQALLPLRSGWKIDREARSMFLDVGYISGPRTIVNGIQSLEPGALFVADRDGLHKLFSFRETSAHSFHGTRRDAVDHLATIVDVAVERQLVSDRPVGIFLSGGLDSSVILSSMRKLNPSGTIQSFTTRFRHNVADPKFNIDADIARRTAKTFGCDHHEIDVGAEDVMREAEGIAKHLGQPHANSAVIALDAAARLASSQVPVVLSGDGGDEVFGGYERYRLYAQAASFLRSSVARRVLWTVVRHTSKRTAWQDVLNAQTEEERLLTFHAVPSATRSALFGEAGNTRIVLDRWRTMLNEMTWKDPVARFMALDRETWLQDDAFVRADRMTMRHGVELRVPILDDEVVAFASSLPREWHITPFQTKRLWRDAFADRCPPEVLAGKKRGWITPAAKWLRAGLQEWAHDLLEEAIQDHVWLNGPMLRHIWKDHQESRRYGLYEIWTAISYQLWWRQYRHVIHDV